MTVFFFCPKLQQPGITLREELDNVNPTYFQPTVREAVCRSEMKSDSEMWIQLTALLSGSDDYNDRNGNYGIFPFEDVSEWGSDHAENGGIKGGEVQIVNIDFH